MLDKIKNWDEYENNILKQDMEYMLGRIINPLLEGTEITINKEGMIILKEQLISALRESHDLCFETPEDLESYINFMLSSRSTQLLMRDMVEAKTQKIVEDNLTKIFNV